MGLRGLHKFVAGKRKGREEGRGWKEEGKTKTGEGEEGSMTVFALASVIFAAICPTQFITKIVPPTGQSVDQFSYTDCRVFCMIFVTAVAPKLRFKVLLGYVSEMLCPSHSNVLL